MVSSPPCTLGPGLAHCRVAPAWPWRGPRKCADPGPAFHWAYQVQRRRLVPRPSQPSPALIIKESGRLVMGPAKDRHRGGDPCPAAHGWGTAQQRRTACSPNHRLPAPSLVDLLPVEAPQHTEPEPSSAYARKQETEGRRNAARGVLSSPSFLSLSR